MHLEGKKLSVVGFRKVLRVQGVNLFIDNV